MNIHTYHPQNKWERWFRRIYKVKSNLLSKYLEGDTKSVLLIRGTYYQYWLT